MRGPDKVNFTAANAVRALNGQLIVWAALLVLGCHSRLPDRTSKTYADYVSAFYVGLAALQVGDDVRAERELGRATQIVPGEPAAWANWGVLALRQRNLDSAGQRLAQAQKLAPKNDHIYYLLGLVEAGRGRSGEAIADLRKAVELNPNNLIATYRLGEEIERQGDANSDAEFERLLERLVSAEPNNMAALLDLARVAAKRGDSATLKQALAEIKTLSHGWPPEIQEQVEALDVAAAGTDTRAAATRTTFLRNALMRLPDFRQSLAAIKPAPGDEAQPFTHFLRLETPRFTPAPADTAMAFSAEALPAMDETQWTWIGAVSLSGTGAPTVIEANGTAVRLASGAMLAFPGGASKTAPQADGVIPIDFNYDFKTDLVFAGAGGVRFFRQDGPDAFTEVTAQTKLPDSTLNAPYTGGWAVDIEEDGDLDLVLATMVGEPVVLRNNGDNTFTPLHEFPGVSGLRGFVWADLNGDGNPDVGLIDGAGKLHVFLNQRSGRFTEVTALPVAGQFRAVATGDVSHGGTLDLVALQADGEIIRLSDKVDGSGWERVELARIPNATKFLSSEVRLHAADLDNNGAVDLLLGRVTASPETNAPGALVWLADDSGGFGSAISISSPALVFGAADLKSEGRLDLLGLSKDGRPVQAVNHGTKNYYWQTIRPRAKQASGDQRINSFGIGGQIEIRSGLLEQTQPITGPEMHFGLGEQTGVDVARILWPNGSMRAEFALKADQQVVTEQRLKGSCPFLFAYNGKTIEFVKDAVPWGSAIGLRINNLGTATIAGTEEWYKIPREELAARDGYYDLRITGELWETYYYDSLALMTVDHPAGTEVFTDERFVIPAVRPRIIVVRAPHQIARAVDDKGLDVTNLVRDADDRYLDTFGRGQYQGVTRDHYVEVDLGDHVPTGEPLYLIAKGWVHPSDSSINIAISQGSHEQARPLSLEVPDGRGGWVVVRPNLGFPAGRKKICMIDLSRVFPPGVPHKVRLRTNLEVYWDSIEWAQGLPETTVKVTRLAPSVADLHYRGYSVIHQANSSSPEIPDYNQLLSTTQIWRDLEGYYTRYGDVRELLGGIDDRYVIMNAGDEMSLRFAAPEPPPTGWVRDYVIAGDGWIKDGDYNSTYSRTVQPLPYHANRTYDRPPGRLEDEWVYRHNPEDWQLYQTRYVTPKKFEDAMRSKAEK
ncbi:MAG: VCBS repeat-containing protein [Acidobacteriaceae bacterium]|nr:VCBS repeat-containing protein [Acidobacteriaceae bacterium]